MKPVSPCSEENPWIFRRDEFDLLEETFEETMRRHDAGRAAGIHAVEESVIREQDRAEDASEAELNARLGRAWKQASGPCEIHASPEGEAPPFWQQMMHEHRRHPLYGKALAWALPLCHWAEGAYRRAASGNADVYRVLLNAPLVPMKVSFALCEEEHDDRPAVEVAREEFGLAITYVRRIVESLARLEVLGMAPPHSREARAQGEALFSAIEKNRAALERKTPF